MSAEDRRPSSAERMVQLFSAQADEWLGPEARVELLNLCAAIRRPGPSTSSRRSSTRCCSRRGGGAGKFRPRWSNYRRRRAARRSAASFANLPPASGFLFSGRDLAGGRPAISRQHPMLLSYLVATVFSPSPAGSVP